VGTTRSICVRHLGSLAALSVVPVVSVSCARHLDGPEGHVSIARHVQEAAVLVQSISIKRGGRDLLRGNVLEHGEETFTRHASGLEQRWRFLEPPLGSGDLVIRVRVGGAAYVRTAHDGIHLRTPDGHSAIRYGLAEWIDAGGLRRSIQPSWSGSAIEIIVPAKLLESSRYPAILDPIIEAEVTIDEPIQVPTFSTRVALAYGDSVFLLMTRRLGGTDIRDFLFVTRVRASDGTVLDPGGIRIAMAPSCADYTSEPAAAYDGVSNFMIVFDHPDSTGSCRVYGRRVRASDGAILDPVDIEVSPQTNATKPAIAAGPNGFYVTWTVDLDGAHGRRVAFDGSLLDPTDVTLDARFTIDHTSVAYADGTFFIAGTYPSREIRWWRVSASDGTVSDPAGSVLVSSTDADFNDPRARLSGGGGRVLAVWSDTRRAFHDIRARGIDAMTGAVDATDLLINDGSIADSVFPDLAFEGTNFVTVWSDWRSAQGAQIFGRRLTANGALLDGPVLNGGFEVSSPPRINGAPSIACGGGYCLVGWDSNRIDLSRLRTFGRRMTSSTAAFLDPSPVPLITTANAQLGPVSTYSGRDYLVAWLDRRHFDPVDLGSENSTISYDLYAARVRGRDLHPLDPVGIRIVPKLGYAEQTGRAPSYMVASDGSGYLIVWSLDGVKAVRVDASGSIIDASPIVLDPQGSDPSVSFADGRYLVVWKNFVNVPLVEFARIDPVTGTVLDVPPTSFEGALPSGLWPQKSVACDTSNCLIFYTGTVDAGLGLRALRIRMSDGQMLGAPFVVSKSPSAGYPVPASDGTSYFVAWEGKGRCIDFRTGMPVLSSTVTFATSVFSPFMPPWSVTFDGQDYVVVWSHDLGLERAEIRGGRISRDCALKDGLPQQSLSIAGPAEVPTSNLNVPLHVALSSDRAGHTLISYARFDPEPPFETHRVRARLLTNLFDDGTACTSSTSCLSGHCVGGQCCPGTISCSDAGIDNGLDAEGGDRVSAEGGASEDATTDARLMLADAEVFVDSSAPEVEPSDAQHSGPGGSGGCRCGAIRERAPTLRRDTLLPLMLFMFGFSSIAGRRSGRRLRGGEGRRRMRRIAARSRQGH
jgi:hypothetical protein